jgi:hypothetical protein
MSNVVSIGVITTLDSDPDRVLDEAKGKCDGGVVVMGYDADGEFYFSSSIADGGSVLWLMEECKKRLMEIAK